jgi:hypothetical protein
MGMRHSVKKANSIEVTPPGIRNKTSIRRRSSLPTQPEIQGVSSCGFY